MLSKVQKWGNSLAVRLPKEIARELSLKEGSDIEFAPEAGVLLIRPVQKPPLTLKSLVNGVEPGNLHGETDWGGLPGKEIW